MLILKSAVCTSTTSFMLFFYFHAEGRRIERPSFTLPRGSNPVANHLAVPSIKNVWWIYRRQSGFTHYVNRHPVELLILSAGPTPEPRHSSNHILGFYVSLARTGNDPVRACLWDMPGYLSPLAVCVCLSRLSCPSNPLEYMLDISIVVESNHNFHQISANERNWTSFVVPEGFEPPTCWM